MNLIHKNNNGNHPIITKKKDLTLAERASDGISSFFGSWWFLILFLVFILIWMTINVVAWMNHWDPYPFILLNLLLSCISAMQAPVILMSQNREADRDRTAAKYDYAVNRKAEREIKDIQQDLDEIKSMLKKISKAA